MYEDVKMKKQILIIVESLACGGGEKSLVSLLPLIDYNKYDVDLLVYNKVNGIFEKYVDPRVNILPELSFVTFCHKSYFQQLLSFNLLFLFFRVKWALAIRINKKKRHPSEVYWKNCSLVIDSLPKIYDVAIAWGQGNSTHYVAEKVRASKKIAWINANYVLGNHDKYFDLPFYEKMDKIVLVSDELLTLTKEVFPNFSDKMYVIYDVINADLISQMAAVNDVLYDKSKINIVTVGRLEPPKGYLYAVKACNLLVQQGVDIVWYVVGEGSQRKKIESMIHEYGLKDRFILLGEQENPYKYINASDIYVQTSIFEGYCLTLAEARILNKPIVTTNFDVVYDQITDGKNGMIVEMSAEDIAKGILDLISSEELKNRLINNLKDEKKGNIEEANKVMDLFDI